MSGRQGRNDFRARVRRETRDELTELAAPLLRALRQINAVDDDVRLLAQHDAPVEHLQVAARSLARRWKSALDRGTDGRALLVAPACTALADALECGTRIGGFAKGKRTRARAQIAELLRHMAATAPEVSP